MVRQAKRLMLAALVALLAGGLIRDPSGAQASWSWGASNSGGGAAGEELATEREEDPTATRNPDKASPKLMD